MSEFSQHLSAAEQGRGAATEELLELLYHELRQVAAQLLAQERPGQTLQPTALVHEAYLRLAGKDDSPHWRNRRHFVAAAAEAMRRILVENARRKQRIRHGGRYRRVPLKENSVTVAGPSEDLLALDEALAALAAEEPLKAELVKLRYFTGLTLEESAEALGISRATASRYWTFARAWLYDRMRDDAASW